MGSVTSSCARRLSGVTEDGPHDRFDGPWKEALRLLFREFTALLLPDLHRAVAWDEPWEFLDRELQRVTHDASAPGRIVDKLVRLRLRDTAATSLVHVEVQAWHEVGMASRMFQIHARIRDQLGIAPVSLLVLGDTSRTWRPSLLEVDVFGTSLRFACRTVKLIDLDRDELQRSSNPMATVVLAHLAAREARTAEERLSWKWSLVRSLYEKGLDRPTVQMLFRLVDWMLALPADLEREFWRRLMTLEAEQEKPYVTSVERFARAEGREQGLELGRRETLRDDVLRVLAARFGDVPEPVERTVRAECDLDTLARLLVEAATTESIDSFRSA